MTPILGVIASSKLASSPYNGYILGGYNGSANTDAIIMFNFTSETASTLSATLSSARSSTSVAFNNNGVAAYVFAGESGGGSNIMTMDKLTYSTNTKSVSTSGPTSQGRNYAGGIDNTATASYVCGGESGSPLVYFSNFLKFTFSNATWSTGANSSLETNSLTGNENGSTAGYHWNNNGSSYITARKVNFSNDSFSNSFTSASREYSSHAPSNGTTASYQFAGQTRSGVKQNAIQKLTISGESISTLSATLSSARTSVCTMSNWNTAAWCLGGADSSTTNIIQKFTFSGETMSTLAATTPNAIQGNASTSNHA